MISITQLITLSVTTFLSLSAMTAYSAETSLLSCRKALQETLRNVNRELRPQKTVINDDYYQRRSLSGSFHTPGYFSHFGDRFKQKLLSLGEDQHWIDLGAGEGVAILEYYKTFNGKASSTGVTFNKTRGLRNTTEKKLPPQSRIKTGRLFEHIDNSEFMPADLITDLFGVITYTKDLSLTLRKSLSLLKTGGSLFFFHGQSWGQFNTVINVNHYHRDALIPLSKPQTITNFLRLIPGLDVITKDMGSGFYSTEVIKNAEFKPLDIPSFTLIEFYDSNPPYRVFQTKPQ